MSIINIIVENLTKFTDCEKIGKIVKNKNSHIKMFSQIKREEINT